MENENWLACKYNYKHLKKMIDDEEWMLECTGKKSGTFFDGEFLTLKNSRHTARTPNRPYTALRTTVLIVLIRLHKYKPKIEIVLWRPK